ncbi:hypothetical protein FHW83_004234 [Duganella sp. SG902]|uniref:CIS tube protein n=1 Tax=Duganella sp. SG902 TaxID=2587016 RepID=UPI00159EACB8|nr:LysM peptidoglycan-binding domain-containing protein [Duganella sp. SG902]NVM78406.1 hypothetical protein [Duganella sp. SG902]
MLGGLQHMVISAFSNDKLRQPAGEFTVWINPASYRHDYGVKYVDRQGPGSNGASPVLNKVCEETVAFDLVFDATGVIPPPNGGGYPADGVATLVKDFKDLTVTLKGKLHRPNLLKLKWGTLQFECVLSSVNVAYTLFRPDGTPLRAKLSATFRSSASEAALAERANTNSPDMTHLVTVVAGDSLPALCERIYGSSRYYLGVAAFNRLNGFRQLRPGDQLLFPPLSGSNP